MAETHREHEAEKNAVLVWISKSRTREITELKRVVLRTDDIIQLNTRGMIHFVYLCCMCTHCRRVLIDNNVSVYDSTVPQVLLPAPVRQVVCYIARNVLEIIFHFLNSAIVHLLFGFKF